MFEVVESPAFQAWIAELSDSRARNELTARITRIAQGNLGDWKPVQGAVSELRLTMGQDIACISRGGAQG